MKPRQPVSKLDPAARGTDAPERRDAPAALGAFPSVRLRRRSPYQVVTPPRRRAPARRRRSDLAAVRGRGDQQARADRLHAGRRAAVDRQHRRQRRAGGGARHPGHRAIPQHRAEAAHRGRARGVQSREPRLPRDARREGRRPRHRHRPRRRARPLHQSRTRRLAARRGDRQRRDARGAGAPVAGAGGGRRRHPRPLRHDGRARRRHPRAAWKRTAMPTR